MRNRPSTISDKTLDTTFVEAPDLIGNSPKNKKITVLVPVDDIMLAIVFLDCNSVHIIYDKNVFETEKTKAGQKPCLIVKASWKKFFGTQRKSFTASYFEERNCQENRHSIGNVMPKPVNETENRDFDVRCGSTGANVLSQSQPNEDLFTKPNPPAENPIKAEPGRTIVVDGSKIIVKIGDEKTYFDIIAKRSVIDSVLDPTWIPQNPYADPDNKLAVEKAKMDGAKLRNEFWFKHFRYPFNIFERIQEEDPMNYFFVPIKLLLKGNQKRMMDRDWQSVTSSDKPNDSLYVLFDRTKTPQYTGKFQIFETQILK